jgi:hypothetical protein
MKRIYSDIQAYQMTSESGNIEIFIIDSNGSQYKPNLIIPNILAAKRLRDYLDELCRKNKKYLRSIGESVNDLRKK